MELEKSIARLKTATASLEEDEGQEVKAKLALQEAQLLKLNKEPSTTACQLAGIKEARSKYERSVEERRTRRDQGIAKTAERTAVRKEILQKLAAQLAAATEATEALERQLTEKHDERAAQHSKQEEEVRIILTARETVMGDQLKGEKEEAAKEVAKKQTATQLAPPALDDQAEQDPAMAHLRLFQQQLQKQLADTCSK